MLLVCGSSRVKSCISCRNNEIIAKTPMCVDIRNNKKFLALLANYGL